MRILILLAFLLILSSAFAQQEEEYTSVQQDSIRALADTSMIMLSDQVLQSSHYFGGRVIMHVTFDGNGTILACTGYRSFQHSQGAIDSTYSIACDFLRKQTLDWTSAPPLTELRFKGSIKIYFTDNVEQWQAKYRGRGLWKAPALEWAKEEELENLLHNNPIVADAMDIGHGVLRSSAQEEGWSLDGRELTGSLSTEKPREEGVVVLHIWVNKEGEVIRTAFDAIRSNTSSQHLINLAKTSAFKAKFSSHPHTAQEQKGSMTFNFQLQ